MRPLGLSSNALARRIDVPVTRVSEIVRGKRGITADTALRLGRLFGTSSELWLGLQSEYDLRLARRDFASAIERRVVPMRRSEYPSEGGPRARSSVGEPRELYGLEHSPTRDRRRIRRSSQPRGPGEMGIDQFGPLKGEALERWNRARRKRGRPRREKGPTSSR